MRKIFLMASLCVFCFAGFAQNKSMNPSQNNVNLWGPESQVKKDVFKGKNIRTAIMDVFKLKSNKEITAIKSRFQDVFDKNGNLTESIVFNSSGKKLWSQVYEYDSLNNEIKYAFINGRGKIVSSRVKTYTPEGKRLEEIAYKRGGEKIKSRTQYSYTQQGKPLETVYFKSNGKVKTRWKQEYYADGSLKATSIFKGNGKLNHIWSYDCKSEGTLVRKGLKDTSKICTRNDYDKDGNKILITEERSGKNKIVRRIRKIDKKDRDIQNTVMEEDGKIILNTHYQYDSNNNIVDYTLEGTNKRFYFHVTSKYDESSNLIEMMFFDKKDKPSVVYKYNYEKYN